MRSNESVFLIWSCGILSVLLRALQADEGSTGSQIYQKRSSLSLLYREGKKVCGSFAGQQSFGP